MEIKTLRRDMTAINDGRWVDRTEVPALKDMRVKMRGSQTDAVRELIAERTRAGEANPMLKIIWTHCLIDIEGLTDDGKPVPVADLQAAHDDPALEPIGFILLDVLAVVDATREAKEAKVVKN